MKVEFIMMYFVTVYLRPSLLLYLLPRVLRLTGDFYILSSWQAGFFSSCCLALDSSSSFPCPAFWAIAKSEPFKKDINKHKHDKTTTRLSVIVISYFKNLLFQLSVGPVLIMPQHKGAREGKIEFEVKIAIVLDKNIKNVYEFIHNCRLPTSLNPACGSDCEQWERLQTRGGGPAATPKASPGSHRNNVSVSDCFGMQGPMLGQVCHCFAGKGGEAQQGSVKRKASECDGDSHAAGHPVALLFFFVCFLASECSFPLDVAPEDLKTYHKRK
ncbi:hypothetical protein STEG23_025409, partial [Scotinomys teguina]